MLAWARGSFNYREKVKQEGAGSAPSRENRFRFHDLFR